MSENKRKKRIYYEHDAGEQPLNQGDLDKFLGVIIRRAQQAIRRNNAQLLESMEAAIGEFSALGLIAANPGLAQIDIAKELDIDKATMVGLIDRLEGLGYLERKKHPTDRRRYALELTNQGVERFEELKGATSEQEKTLRAKYTRKELKQLLQLLNRLVAQ